MKVVIGIDPGTAACGYGIVLENGGRLKAIDHGWWSTPAGERPELRLKTIFDGLAIRTLCDPSMNRAATLRVIKRVIRTLLEEAE